MYSKKVVCLISGPFRDCKLKRQIKGMHSGWIGNSTLLWECECAWLFVSQCWNPAFAPRTAWTGSNNTCMPECSRGWKKNGLMDGCHDFLFHGRWQTLGCPEFPPVFRWGAAEQTETMQGLTNTNPQRLSTSRTNLVVPTTDTGDLFWKKTKTKKKQPLRHEVLTFICALLLCLSQLWYPAVVHSYR